MTNRFVVLPCLNLEREKDIDIDSDSPVVVMASSSDESLVLFFPIDEKHADMVNYAIKEDSVDSDTDNLGVYMTMIESWRAGDRYLSGIVMDAFYDDEVDDDIILVRIILSNKYGAVDSLVRINFLHAIILSAMEKVDIIISNTLLNRLLPDLFDEDEGDDYDDYGDYGEDDHITDKDFPKDQKISDIAHKIMSGDDK